MQHTLLQSLAFNVGELAILIPIISVLIGLVIPVVAILTKHQQKMAEMIHGGQQDNQLNAELMHELHALRSEISHLKETVHQQAIALDDVRPIASGDIQDRIGENNAN